MAIDLKGVSDAAYALQLAVSMEVTRAESDTGPKAMPNHATKALPPALRDGGIHFRPITSQKAQRIFTFAV